MSALPDTQSDFSHEIIGAAVEVQRVLGKLQDVPVDIEPKYAF